MQVGPHRGVIIGSTVGGVSGIIVAVIVIVIVVYVAVKWGRPAMKRWRKGNCCSDQHLKGIIVTIFFFIEMNDSYLVLELIDYGLLLSSITGQDSQ